MLPTTHTLDHMKGIKMSRIINIYNLIISGTHLISQIKEDIKDVIEKHQCVMSLGEDVTTETK
jgi:hypothetical protein